MKVLYIIIILILFIVPGIQAEEIPFLKFNSRMFDRETGLFELPIKFTYAKDDELVNLYYQSDHRTVALLLHPEEQKLMTRYIETFQDWNKKAKELHIHLTKRIGKIKLNVYFRYGGHWHRGSSVVVDVIFFSLTSKRHQLLLRPGRVTSHYYSLLPGFKPNIVYLDTDEVQQFKNALDKNYRDKRIQEAETVQQGLDDLYDKFK